MAFDPIAYKTSTRQQWDEAAEAWHRWEIETELDRFATADGLVGPCELLVGAGTR